ncbi:hypothetical protein BS17DRAFT_64878 [Gyrodon lividus]|nr:hypothetical protein BS17DRAFT_64878 [Gyrodon lividus]
MIELIPRVVRLLCLLNPVMLTIRNIIPVQSSVGCVRGQTEQCHLRHTHPPRPEDVRIRHLQVPAVCFWSSAGDSKYLS